MAKKIDPPRTQVIDNYTNGESVIKAIEDFADKHNCSPKDIYMEIEKDYGYYDEVSCAIMMYAPKKKAG